jgi:hypothetical protein
MEPVVSMPLLQEPATCHYIKQSCVAAAKSGAFSVFTSVRIKPDVINKDMGSH